MIWDIFILNPEAEGGIEGTFRNQIALNAKPPLEALIMHWLQEMLMHHNGGVPSVA